jgi:DNA-binding response OmpR family regulator
MNLEDTDNLTIFTPTDKGKAELKAGSTKLSTTALEGYEPRVASSRDEIVAELRASPLPDAILLDVNLPGTDGFDILVRVRQHPALRAIPVIMLTAQTSRTDVLRGLSGGANGYITKPFEHEALMKSLRAVLGLTD